MLMQGVDGLQQRGELVRRDAQGPALLVVHEAQFEALAQVAFQAAPFGHAPGDAQCPGGHVPEVRPGVGAGAENGPEVEVMGGQEIDDAGPRIVPHRQVQQRQHRPDAIEAAQGLLGRGVERDAVLGKDLLDPRQVGLQGARHHAYALELDPFFLHQPEQVLGHGEDFVPGPRATDDLAVGGPVRGRERVRGAGARCRVGSRAAVEQIHHLVRPGEPPEVAVVEVLGEGPVRMALGKGIEQGHRVVAGNAPKKLQLALGQVVEAVVVDAFELPEMGRDRRVPCHRRIEVLVVLGLPFREAARHFPVQRQEVAQRVPVRVAEESLPQRLQGGLGVHHGILQVPQALPQGRAGAVVLHHPGEPSTGRDHALEGLLHERLVPQCRPRRTVHLVEQVQADLEEGEDVEVQQAKAALLGQQNLHAPAQSLRGYHQQERGQRVVLLASVDLLRQGVFELGVIGTEDDFHGGAGSFDFARPSTSSGLATLRTNGCEQPLSPFVLSPSTSSGQA